MNRSVAGYVELLVDALAEKEEILKLLYLKTKAQEDLFRNEELTVDELDASIEEKQELIDRLVKLDDGFEQAFEAIKPEIENNKAEYGVQIVKMQQHIRDITTLSAQIKSLEARNMELAKAKFAGIRKDIRGVKQSQKAVATYYQNAMSSGQLLDHKN